MDEHEPQRAPYGTWVSPITLDHLVDDVVGLSFPMLVDDHVYWSEARPAEGGRQALVRRALRRGAEPEDVFGPGRNARTLVHEYGGLCYAVLGGALTGEPGTTVLFSEYADQRLYRGAPGAEPVAVTPDPHVARAVRFAAPVGVPGGAAVVAVRQRHPEPDVPDGVVNDLVEVPVGGGEPRVLAEGHDFYSHPAVSGDGRRLCWVSWDHPNMPWDGTELWEGELGDGAVHHARKVAGGPSESVVQPKYAPDGRLLFLSDRTGWWNLYAAAPEGGEPVALAPMEAELGAPDWVFGTSSYAVLADGSVVAAWSENGLGRLGVLWPGAAAFMPLDTPWTTFAQLRAADDGRSVVAVAGSSTEPSAIVRIVPGESCEGAPTLEVVRRSRQSPVDASCLSVPEPIDFPSAGGRRAHALFYPPTNAGYEPLAGELPPVVLRAHGGPTSAATSVLDYGIQFWTSRGFAYVDVNYGGSTGYGRAYRELLRKNWGVVDLEDCVHAVRHLAETGRVDGARAVIRGGSAGGYTTLCAATFTDVFAAGASLFGVADAKSFVSATHKFESRYTEGLFGPWPRTADRYLERSPASHAELLRTPLIVFQGLEDKIVPPEQAEIMVAALDRNAVPYAYLPYEGEQHGFRRRENVRRTAEAELYFYGRVLGFVPADDLEPVEIVHAERLASATG